MLRNKFMGIGYLGENVSSALVRVASGDLKKIIEIVGKLLNLQRRWQHQNTLRRKMI